MTSLNDSGRSKLLAALQSELFGPEQLDSNVIQIKQIDFGGSLSFDEPRDAEGVFREQFTGSEILTRDRPTKRYGVGVLYPREQGLRDVNEESEPAPIEDSEDQKVHPIALQEPKVLGVDPVDDDFDLTATSEYRPSAMAVSFLAEIEEDDRLKIDVSGGYYESKRVTVGKSNREWFVRKSLSFSVEFMAPTSPGRQRHMGSFDPTPLSLSVDLLARRHGSMWLCTIALINEAGPDKSAETHSLFQSAFSVSTIRRGEPFQGIVPYPDARSEQLMDRDSEARSLDLLYRNAPTFGVGHGCAATWDEGWGELRSSAVYGTALPTFEIPSVTPDVFVDGIGLEVPVAPLAGLDPRSDGFDAVANVADAYGKWIAARVIEAKGLSGSRRRAAEEHISLCKRAHERIIEGLEWLRDDPIARRAFVLANRAILDQYLHFRRDARKSRLTPTGVEVEPGGPVRTWQEYPLRWRAFQIGFLVAAAHSSVKGDHQDRHTVELIFFPTGGGKTEAYLGLAAFCLFYERLTSRTTGVSVLMRYTLRLLTSQQFLRTSALVCAMELIRKQNDDVVGGPFSVGIWVGRSTTPNTRADAVAAFKAMMNQSGENPFLVLRCPRCAAQMGPIEAEKGVPKKTPRVAGYRESGGRIEFRCPDRQCDFNLGLPIYVVDEDLYSQRPSIVIATVDKLAMLAFTPAARSLFGFDSSGSRDCDPPSLIIQDELHLIAGPLGSMVGLYEAVIEDLCTDRRAAAPLLPKIVGSTATIRNYSEQINGLYGRRDAALFPPHGLDASDSFFAQYRERPRIKSFITRENVRGSPCSGLGFDPDCSSQSWLSPPPRSL